jgi:D-alanyl-D-alanine carboxypeptidase/D-alanyl-D-alanine-endopeptidase (penicillin-binding protein 4)
VAALQLDIESILAAPALAVSSWGVMVTSLAHNDTLYALNARKLLIPASNMKVVTLAAAADALGWDYRYETRLFGGGPIASGTLNGDLIVVGAGDPAIGDRDGSAARLFAQWADDLHARGIETIAGRVVGDDNAFEDEPWGAGWSWDDLGEAFAAPTGALQFNENAVQLAIAPAASVGAPARVTLAPDGSALEVQSLVSTGGAGSAPSVERRRLPGSARLELRGSVAIDAAPILLTVAIDNPTLFFASALRNALIARGIAVRGRAVDIDDLSDPPVRSTTPLVTYRSAPLSELAMRLMKNSQNLYAETLLKTVGAVRGTGSVAGGRAAAGSVLSGWNMPSDGLVQADGSGLSRYNLVTPEMLVAILTHVDRDDRLRDPFEAALPIAGVDGTLATRLKGTAAEGTARAKTGAMTGVRSTSGFVESADGEPLVFSIIANNFDVPAAVVVQTEDAIILRLAAFRRSAAGPPE